MAKLNACLTNGCHYCCIAEMEKSGNELLQSHLKPEEDVSRKSSVIVATTVLTKLRRHAKLIKEKRGMSFITVLLTNNIALHNIYINKIVCMEYSPKLMLFSKLIFCIDICLIFALRLVNCDGINTSILLAFLIKTFYQLYRK